MFHAFFLYFWQVKSAEASNRRRRVKPKNRKRSGPKPAIVGYAFSQEESGAQVTLSRDYDTTKIRRF
jgi:hypothetical protein